MNNRLLQFDELRVDEVRGVLLQEETCLSLGPTATAVDLRTLERFDEFLFVGLVQFHGVAAGHALKHGGVKSRSHPCDFGGYRIDGDHPADVVGTKLRDRADLVAWQMNDANKRHQVAFAGVQQKLTQRLIGGSEMVFGVGQNVLSEFVVVTFNLAKRYLEGPLVRPHF